MEYVARGARKVLVLPACAEHAEAEFAARDCLAVLVISMRGQPFWKRWGDAREVYRLRRTAETRLFQNSQARALRAVILLCSPKWFGRFIASHWQE